MEKCEEMFHEAIGRLELAWKSINEAESLLSCSMSIFGLERKRDIVLRSLQECNHTIKNITEDMEETFQRNIEVVYGPPPSFEDEKGLLPKDVII